MVARSGLVLSGAEGKGAQAYRPVLQRDRQECLSLPRHLYEKCSRGKWRGENRYFLPNKANKSFGINKSSSKEVKKATRRRTEATNQGVIQWLLERFAGKCK